MRLSWIIKKSNSASCEARDNSLVSATSGANLVSGCKTILVLHRAKPYLSLEAKTKAPLGASSEATTTLLISSALMSSARETFSREAKVEAPLGACIETTTASFRPSTTSSSRVKALSAHIASPCEAKVASSIAKRKASKAKPKRANFEPLGESSLDQVYIE